jgi:D-xylulose kinase
VADTKTVVAIDVGTSGTRTAVINTKNGAILSQTHQEYTSFFPHPAWVEQNAEDWWETTCTTAQASLTNSAVDRESIIGVSITNQRETIVPVDNQGQPLYRAIVWQDRRTVPQCDFIQSVLGADTVYRETGLTVDPYFSGPKLLWLKEHKPEVFRKTAKFLLVHDFIFHRLSDQFATDYSNASRTMLFSIEKHQWSELMCSRLEIPPEKLPTPFPSGTAVGNVTPEAAEATHLPEGIPVVVGGGDQQCGAVGVGVVQPGRVKATIGTGTFILAFENQPTFDPQRRLLCSCHAVPNKWVIEASIFTSGIIYRWFRDQFAQEEKQLAQLLNAEAYELMDKQAQRSPPGARGVLLLPHFVGAGAPHWNPNARGVLVGLALGHTRADILRAIMEGTAFEVRRNLKVMEELNIPIQELRLTGGATRSALWNQIQADITQVKVIRSQIEEATAVGAAILAAVGGGVYPDVERAVKQMVTVEAPVLPSKTSKVLYDRLFTLHTDVYQALEKAKVFSRLSTVER